MSKIIADLEERTKIISELKSYKLENIVPLIAELYIKAVNYLREENPTISHLYPNNPSFEIYLIGSRATPFGWKARPDSDYDFRIKPLDPEFSGFDSGEENLRNIASDIRYLILEGLEEAGYKCTNPTLIDIFIKEKDNHPHNRTRRLLYRENNLLSV